MWHAQRIVRNSGAAEDLVQDCLIRAWLNLDKFRGESQVYTWLHRILLNMIFNHLQRTKHEAMPFSTIGEGLSEDDFDIPDDDSPEAHLIAKQRAQSLLGQLDTLPPPFTNTLQLRYQNDLSYEEIAKKLGISINTVRTRLHRARLVLGIK
jgi:RNA polymerase sigma-70 factor (ECF subfamily)